MSKIEEDETKFERVVKEREAYLTQKKEIENKKKQDRLKNVKKIHKMQNKEKVTPFLQI